jgi:hypothetical protein
MDVDRHGVLYAKSQVTDYISRGDSIEEFSILDFFKNTYETKIAERKNNEKGNNTDEVHFNTNMDEETIRESTTNQRGRPRNQRVRYKPIHPKWKALERVVRSHDHNNLPNFIGHQLPRNDDPGTYNFYCASMLMLLKPWRNLGKDLKRPGQTWSAAFDEFMCTASREARAVLTGIQYLHECHTAAEDNQIMNTQTNGKEDYSTIQTADELQLDESIEVEGESMEYDERGLQAIIRSQTSLSEDIHGRLAIELAKKAKVFENDSLQDSWCIPNQCDMRISNASGDDMQKLIQWKTQMQTDLDRMNGAINNRAQETAEFECSTVERLDPNGGATADDGPVVERIPKAPVYNDNSGISAALTAVSRSALNDDQKRAYDIIVWHLKQTLSGKKCTPLRMIIHGEGGTGKSKVLQSVTEAFRQHGAHHMLLKAAYTGVAASLIDGKTTHVIAGVSLSSGLPSGEKTLSDEAKAKLEMFWKPIKYLFVDEMSMLAKDFFALLSRNASIGKRDLDNSSFGGINVVILGDFHQFPPVARSIQDALYYPSNVETDSLQSQIGRSIYEEFQTVVTLKEQKRVSDPIWLRFLRHLRAGQVCDEDLKMLRSLIIGNTNNMTADFSTHPWKHAALVTPRHAVRKRWNDEALRKVCRENGRRIYVCTADDTYQGRPLNIKEKCLLESHRTKKGSRNRVTKDLPYQVEIAIGMRVMVTENVETDLDITNGACGEIVGIILHEDELPIAQGAVVKLRYLPAYILVKLSRTKASKLAGLDDCVIPVEPTSTTYRMTMTTKGGKKGPRTVRRRQFPITAAYAFTDYRSQGQTITYVLVDIAPPPRGTLSLFNLYVALSRSSGRDTIRLLRDFDDDMFRKSHDPALLQEVEQLEKMDSETEARYGGVALLL